MNSENGLDIINLGLTRKIALQFLREHFPDLSITDTPESAGDLLDMCDAKWLWVIILSHHKRPDKLGHLMIRYDLYAEQLKALKKAVKKLGMAHHLTGHHKIVHGPEYVFARLARLNA